MHSRWAIPSELNQRWFLHSDRHGNKTPADRTFELSPVSAAMKTRCHYRATLRAFSIRVAVIIRILFRYEFALWH